MILGEGEVDLKSIGERVIRQHMTELQLTENMTLDRRLLRTRIRIEGWLDS